MKIRRRHFLSGLLGLLSGAGTLMRGQAVSAPSSNTIEVSTVEEFFKAIGSNRTIRLIGQRYNFSELSPQLQWTNASIREVYDGYELVISGVENLKIESLGQQPSLLVTEPRYASVLNFENCRNITVSKIEAGHWPEKGYCNGSVLKFSDCENIRVDASVLYGSGTYGVSAYNTLNLSIANLVIKECTYGITSLDKVQNFIANNCQFYNNIGVMAFIIVRNCPKSIAFKKCEFYENSFDGDYTFSDFFYIEESEPILVQNCLIRNNRAGSFANNPSLVRLVDTQLKNNDFKREQSNLPELPPPPKLLPPPSKSP